MIAEVVQMFGGQVRRYGDSVYKYEVVLSEPATSDEVWAWCQAHPTLYHARHRDDAAIHDGASSFPYGLDAYGSVRPVNDWTWEYTVTLPYAD